jgi:MerR family mercuric resistance operon transcriptional regulator
LLPFFLAIDWFFFSQNQPMTIGELAKKAAVNVQTIRFYEREGLLPDAHRWPDSGYRDFDDDALRRLRFIRSAKQLGFTLREISELLDMRILPGESCAEVRQMIGAKLADLDRRMREMRRLRRSLVKLEAACGKRASETTCPALWAIVGK